MKKKLWPSTREKKELAPFEIENRGASFIRQGQPGSAFSRRRRVGVACWEHSPKGRGAGWEAGARTGPAQSGPDARREWLPVGMDHPGYTA